MPGGHHFSSRIKALGGWPNNSSTDGGSSWFNAKLGPQPSQFAWHGWIADWDATTGRHTLMVRATDTNGNRQPVGPEWNIQGMGNNMAQTVDVIVEAGAVR